MQILIRIVLICSLWLFHFHGFSQDEDHIPGEAIIQFKSVYHASSNLIGLSKQLNQGYTIERALYPELGIYLITFDPSKSIHSVIRDLNNDDDILYVQRNQKVTSRETEPNDPLFLDQWYHKTINSASAWDITTGGTDINGREIVIAVLDSGFDISHEDLADNIWINNDEIPNDNIDNDGNGYVDDYYGWNPFLRNDEHEGSSIPTLHGTNVAGLAGAIGDNDSGIAGVAWNVKLLFLSGLKTSAEIIEANRYTSETRKLYNQTNGEEGAYIVASSISLGIENGKAEDYPIWCNLYDAMGQNGILNVAATANSDIDVDVDGDMPTTCSSEYLIAVTNSDINNLKSDRAAYGKISIDIAAPGTDIITTAPSNNYIGITGTSASAPLVAGTIALLYSAPCQSIADQSLLKPGEIALTMRNMIYNGAQPASSLENITSQGSVLNVWGSIQALDRNCDSSATPNSKITILPNPINREAEDIVIDYVALSADEDSYIRIFDAKGALIIERKINSTFFGSTRISLPMQNRLSPGIYFVSMNLPNNQSISEKLVVY